MGKRKIEIAKIKDQNKRHVCFSKRRMGLFKKASELSTLCDADVGVVVFSAAGKPYIFGSPRGPETVIRRYLARSSASLPAADERLLLESAVPNHALQLESEQSLVVAEKKKTHLGGTLKRIDVEAIDDLDELENLQKRLNQKREMLTQEKEQEYPSEPADSEEFDIFYDDDDESMGSESAAPLVPWFEL